MLIGVTMCVQVWCCVAVPSLNVMVVRLLRFADLGFVADDRHPVLTKGTVAVWPAPFRASSTRAAKESSSRGWACRCGVAMISRSGRSLAVCLPPERKSA